MFLQVRFSSFGCDSAVIDLVRFRHHNPLVNVRKVLAIPVLVSTNTIGEVQTSCHK